MVYELASVSPFLAGGALPNPPLVRSGECLHAVAAFQVGMEETKLKLVWALRPRSRLHFNCATILICARVLCRAML